MLWPFTRTGIDNRVKMAACTTVVEKIAAAHELEELGEYRRSFTASRYAKHVVHIHIYIY